jgi:hypothetical protein
MEGPIQPTDVFTVTCPQCNSAIAAGKIFCAFCGYPANGTTEQKNSYEAEMLIMQDELEVARRRVKTARNTLYVLAGITLFFGLITAAASSSDTEMAQQLNMPAESLKTLIIIAVAIGALLYAGLGYWSNRKPFAALLTATIIFSLSAISSITRTGFNIAAMFTFIIQIAIISALVYGVMGGNTIEKIKRKLKIT